jgi:hypothetical protein
MRIRTWGNQRSRCAAYRALKMLRFAAVKRRLISIEHQIPGLSGSFHEYSSEQSLLDADVVIFQPMSFGGSAYGKVSFDEEESFRLTEMTQHWHRELSVALESGKTIFLIFRKREVASIHTGRKEFKGSKLINYFTEYSNYNFLPIQLPAIVPKGGTEITFSGDPQLATFWKEFRSYLHYECYLNESVKRPLFFTKTGEKPVGAVVNVGKGHFVILPPLDYERPEFVKEDVDEVGEEIWTPAARAFGKRLVEALFDIDKALRAEDSLTPPPEWVKGQGFISRQEASLRTDIESVQSQILELRNKESRLRAELSHRGLPRHLLFETGKPLEAAVQSALTMLGYYAQNYDDGTLELDQVILSPEGDRYIGECEGKDNSAISIEKLRQLAENIQSDYEREDVEKEAVGILFGNGFRLVDPAARPEQFTTKCLTSAKRGTILVRTADLYPVVRYLEEARDESFKKACRESIRAGVGGIVQFPMVPTCR